MTVDLMEAIRERRSIRKFLPDSVDEADLKEIVQAGTLAPNAENDQMWHFIAVTNRDIIRQIGDSVSARVDAIDLACKKLGYAEYNNHKYFSVFFKDAPGIITAFCRPSINASDRALSVLNMELKTPVSICPVQQSMGAAIQNISLAAHAKGYGTTWMYAPVLAYREVAQLLNVPEPWVLSALLPIGRPAQQPKARTRKPIDEVFSLIK
jgi:nitroreductase